MRLNYFLCLFALGLVGCTDDNAVGAGQSVDSGPSADVGVSVDLGVGDATADTGESCADCQYTPAIQAERGTQLAGLSFPRGAGGRSLKLLVRYASDAPQPLPVILWAHGGGFNDEGQRLSQVWSAVLVRAGYAVVHWSTSTPDAAALASICEVVELPADAACDDANIAREEGDEVDNPFSSIAVVRAADPVAILSELDRLGDKIETDTGVDLDLESVAVAGWSGGSQSTVGVAGAVRNVADSIPPWGQTHPLPKAFVAISPQGPGNSKFFADDSGTSWDAVRGPLLVVTGEGDEKPANDLTGVSRRAVFEHLPAGDKWLFYSTLEHPAIEHGSYNLGQLETPGLEAFNASLQSVVLAFLDAHLRGDAAARSWLDSGTAVDAAGGHAEWTTK